MLFLDFRSLRLLVVSLVLICSETAAPWVPGNTDSSGYVNEQSSRSNYHMAECFPEKLK